MVMGGPVIPAEELLSVPPAEALDRLRREVETMRMKLRAELREQSRGRFPAPGPGDV